MDDCNMPMPFRSRHALPMAMALLGATATAAPGSAELVLTGQGPYFILGLPTAIYSLAGAPGLAGVQVVNARGDVLPSAWADAPATATPVEHRSAVRLFKLPATAASGATVAPAGGWVIDVKPLPGHMVSLDLTLPATRSGVYTLSVEAGDDLQHWRPVQPAAQVMSLQHQGQRLASTRIDLGGARARYLRLTALPGSGLPELSSAEVTSVTGIHARPAPLQWTTPVEASQCVTSACDYPLPPSLPVSQVNVLLDEPNTLLTVDLLGQVDPAEAGAASSHRSRHLLRHPVHALRHKHETVETETGAPAWEPLATADVYRLQLPQGEVRSGPVWLPNSQAGHASLRLRTRGPIGLAGVRPPRLRFGSPTRSLVFLARGPAPYRLTWGTDPSQAPPAMSLAQLMPARHEDDPLPRDSAVLAAVPVAASSTASAPVSAPSVSKTRSPRAKYALWAALLTGLGLMGGMAWSLLRSASRRRGG